MFVPRHLYLTIAKLFGKISGNDKFADGACCRPAIILPKCCCPVSGSGYFDRPERGERYMTKSELIARLAERNPHLYQRDIERIVSTIFDEVSSALANGDRVELRGFGAFSVKKRDARQGRNPRTGESVEVSEKAVPYFKTGKQLRELLNSKT